MALSKSPDEYLEKELPPDRYKQYKEGLLGRKKKNFCDDCIAVCKSRAGGTFYPRCERAEDEWANLVSRGLPEDEAALARTTVDTVEWAKHELGWEARWYQAMGLRCLKGDQWVFMGDGSIKQIQDVQPGEKVVAYNEIRRSFSKSHKVLATHQNGIRRVFRLTLDNGDTLDVTNDHPILCHAKAGAKNPMFDCPSYKTIYKSLKEGLTVGDKVYTCNSFDVFGKEKDKGLAAFLGYLSTDGYISLTKRKHIVQFSNTRKPLADEFYRLGKQLFPDTNWTYKEVPARIDKNGVNHKKYWLISTYNSSTSIFSMLRGIGATVPSTRETAIFRFAFQFSKDALKVFINRAWSGDGCVYIHPAGSASLTLTSGSREALVLMRLLLKKLGVWRSKIYRDKAEGQGKGLRLSIDRSLDIKHWFTEVGEVFGKEIKSRCAASLAEATLARTNNCRKRGKFLRSARSYIVSIEDLGEHPVYDIEVETRHNFVANGVIVHNCTSAKIALRMGRRCLAAGSLIMTPEGPKPIESLGVGNLVYSEDGHPIKVLDVIDQGMQEVVDIYNHNIKLASSTLDHIWLIKDRSGLKEKRLGDCRRDDQIARKEVACPLGTVNEPAAYVLGALLGGGCCREHGLVISSADEPLVKKVAGILGKAYRRNHPSNYSWGILKANKLEIPYYQEWCHNLYAHQKKADLSIIKTWNRTTLLNFMAGLLDTDGSVYFDGSELTVSIGMQAKSVIDAFKYGLLALWSMDVNLLLDSRPKYKDGPLYVLRTKNIYECKRILKELSPYLAVERKKYQAIYDTLVPHNFTPTGRGFGGASNLKNPRLERCYDITVDSSRNLYLLANGLVTHNCGKTAMLAVKALFLAATKPGTKEDEPYIVLVIAPYENQLAKIFDYMREFLSKAKTLKPTADKYDPQILGFANNSTIKGFTSGAKAGARSAKIRGEDGHAIIIDEIALIRDEDVDTILAILASHEKCLLYYSTTPSGLPDKFKEACEDPKQRFKEFWFASQESPSYSDDADETFKVQMAPTSYVHEILADWGTAEGGVFLPGAVRAALSEYPLGQPLLPDEFGIIGVDCNDKNNGTHAVVLAARMVDKRTLFRIADKKILRGSEFSVKKSEQMLIEMYHRWKPVLLVLDKGYAQSHIEFLIDYAMQHPEYNMSEALKHYDLGSSYKFINPINGDEEGKPFKPLMVGLSARVVQEGRLTIPSCEDTPVDIVGQMLKFQVEKQSPTGQPRYSQGNDHTLTALMLAIMGWVLEVTGFEPMHPSDHLVSISTTQLPDDLVLPFSSSQRRSLLQKAPVVRSLDDEPRPRPRRINPRDLKKLRSNINTRRKMF